MLLDTNIVIYACKTGGEWLGSWTNAPEAAIASVTRIEALGYAGISGEEDSAIRGVISTSLNYPLDDEIIERAILLPGAGAGIGAGPGMGSTPGSDVQPAPSQRQ